MKIALFIFPIHPSHGCLLQTFALFSKLKEMGADVDIIDRQWDSYSFKFEVIRTLHNLKEKIKGTYPGPIYYRGLVNPVKMRELKLFVDKYLGDRTKHIYNDKALSKIDWNKYDAIVVGSDQTWRPKYVPNIYNYFLDFAEKAQIKRISYAASFGTDEWEFSDVETKRCSELAKKFNSISVRELSGVELCKKHLGVDSIHVIDPTLLLRGKDYIDILGLINQGTERIASYWLDRTEEKVRIQKRIALFFGKDIVEVNREMENPVAAIEKQVAPSMREWLESSLSAQFVIVDSFHAMVFAILFHKQFLVVGNKERGLSRFVSLLKYLELDDSLILGEKELKDELLTRKIDWDKVDEKLQFKRNESIAYLRNAIQF